MLGLCHICFTSGIPIFITKNIVHCENCKNGKTQEKEKETSKGPLLKFEDLPQIDKEHRSDYAENLVRIKFDKELDDQITEDRLHDRD